jgi:hypothetical protein
MNIGRSSSATALGRTVRIMAQVGAGSNGIPTGLAALLLSSYEEQ